MTVVKQRAREMNLSTLIAVFTVIAFIFAALSWFARGVQMSEQLADKQYVQATLVEGKHYTDEKVELLRKEGEQIRKDAYEHSDTNRQFMMLKMEEMNGKITNASTALAAKVDMLLTQLQTMALSQGQIRFKPRPREEN